MAFEKRVQEQAQRLKTMGWVFFLLALTVSSVTYFLPDNPNNYWFSSEGKTGFYVLSGFFIFLGLYCWGAIWRKGNFI